MKKSLAITLALMPSVFAGDNQVLSGKFYSFEYVKYFSMSEYDVQGVSSSSTGTIKGKVIFTGNRIPKNKRKLITKDKKVCGKGFKVDTIYEISPNKGIKNAVIYIDNINLPVKENKTLVQEKCEFKPRVLAMSAGSTLTVVNNDPVKHEATGVQNFETIFKLSQHKQGMKDKITLKKPGIVKVTCSIHGWMKGWVILPKNPYYAVSNEEGEFIIRNVPTGKYTLKLWHEGFKEKSITVNVKKGKTTNVVFELSK